MATTKTEKPPVVIDVQNVTKKFRVYSDKGATLKERILFRNRRAYSDHWVLKGISFQIRKGEAVGLVGENGCGKSTTLKLLTKILYPDSGTITMKGRISSLIELGAGFHPDMTGRENIYTNASIFGLSKAEIDKRLEGIIAFSELGSYIDNPVRTYSSGMYMRLAFAVAINVDADILLIDEILAVGDASYQAKCLNKLREIKRHGTTIVIVSHALGQIEQFCERSIWIESGEIREQGSPFDVHQKYLRFMSSREKQLTQDPDPEDSSNTPDDSPDDSEELADVSDAEPQADNDEETDDMRWGSKDIYFTSVYLLDEAGKETTTLESGRPFSIVMNYKVARPFEEPAFGIGIIRNDGLQCYGTNTVIENMPLDATSLGTQGSVRVVIDDNTLIEGEYDLDVAIHKPDGFAYDYYRSSVRFRVYSVLKDAGVMRLDHTWHISAGNISKQ